MSRSIFPMLNVFFATRAYSSKAAMKLLLLSHATMAIPPRSISRTVKPATMRVPIRKRAIHLIMESS